MNNSQISSTKSVFMETGGFQPQYLRPMDVSTMTATTLETLSKVTNNGTAISPVNLTSVANDIVAPTMAPQGIVNIHGGFESRRLRFMIELTIRLGLSGATLRKIVTGYTDHYGIGLRNDPRYGYFDPNMRLIINNVMTLRDVAVPTAMGLVTQTTIADSDQLLIGNVSGTLSGQRDFTLRAEDVYRQMQLPTMLAQSNLHKPFFNSTSSFQDGVVKSRRSNTVATSYLSTMLKANQEAVTTANAGLDNLSDTMGRAMGIAQENTIDSDSVLNWFNELGEFKQTCSVYWMELVAACPDIVHMTKVIQAETPQQRANVAANMHSQHWHSTGPASKIAIQLSTNIPGMMFDCGIGTCSFIYTNMVPQGVTPEVEWCNPAAESLISGLDYTPMLQRLKIRIMTEIIPSITSNGLLPISIHVTAGVFYRTHVVVKIGSEQPMEFSHPTYCDQLMSPMLTNNPIHLENAGKQFTNIYGHLSPQNVGNGLYGQHMNFSTELPNITHMPPGMAAAPQMAPQLPTMDQAQTYAVGATRWG